jgi:murein DD-endopeptidase MepM/ murein hydrolase activator NlpD
MTDFYYFSTKKLNYVKIKNFKLKVVIATVSLFALCAILFFTGSLFFNSSNNVQDLQSENKVLRKKVDNILSVYKSLNTQLDSLTSVNNNLRVAVNLKPISKDEMILGVGGGYFDNSTDFLNSEGAVNLGKVTKLVDEASRKISFEKEEYTEIKENLSKKRKLAECIPAIKPLPGEITSGFGMRMHPILHYKRMHDGIDILSDVGSPVRAAGDGVIEFAGIKGGYGLAVTINHGFGYESTYAHLSKILVKKNQKVLRGEVIAKSGNTGLSTGPHLHYEVVHNGVKLNPVQFFFGDFNYFEQVAKN